ncbi:glutathione S-transferase 1-like [Lycorma delicatula]|uniref:glutathione S-transferase 1-like n=1 Tax=Lycorma delicatula TaxID=130591 RepID=UPI003F50E66A
MLNYFYVAIFLLVNLLEYNDGEISSSSSAVSGPMSDYDVNEQDKENNLKQNNTTKHENTSFKQPKRRALKKAILYYNECNTGVQALKLCIEALNLELKFTNFSSYQKSQAASSKRLMNLLYMNPSKIFPALDDDGFIVFQSNLVMKYLVRQYGSNDKLYPTNTEEESIIEKRLEYFEKVLLPLGRYVVHKVLLTTDMSLTMGDTEEVKTELSYINNILMNSTWIAGNHMTVADFSFVSLINTWPMIPTMPDLNGYLYVTKWLDRCEREIPSYNIIMDQSLAEMKQMWEEKLQKQRRFRRQAEYIKQEINPLMGQETYSKINYSNLMYDTYPKPKYVLRI